MRGPFMHRRRLTRFRPGLERLQTKQLPSVSPLTPHVAHVDVETKAPSVHPAATAEVHGAATDLAKRKTTEPSRFLAFRITNPSYPEIVDLVPPFQQVLV